MLRSTRDMRGYMVDAADGHIGTVMDFYFEETGWAVRYVVVDIGALLPGRNVLVSTEAVGTPQRTLLPLKVSKEQVRTSPDVDTRLPVSRRERAKLHRHYRWPVYWGSMAGPVVGPEPPEAGPAREPQEEPAETGLRSTHEVMGYGISATDGHIGHVADLIVETDVWALRYLVVDTRDWLPGKNVLLPPEWSRSFSWQDRSVLLNVSKAEVENAPEFNPAEPINRAFEEHLYDYYGRPKYWVA